MPQAKTPPDKIAGRGAFRLGQEGRAAENSAPSWYASNLTGGLRVGCGNALVSG